MYFELDLLAPINWLPGLACAPAATVFSRGVTNDSKKLATFVQVYALHCIQVRADNTAVGLGEKCVDQTVDLLIDLYGRFTKLKVAGCGGRGVSFVSWRADHLRNAAAQRPVVECSRGFLDDASVDLVGADRGLKGRRCCWRGLLLQGGGHTRIARLQIGEVVVASSFQFHLGACGDAKSQPLDFVGW